MPGVAAGEIRRGQTGRPSCFTSACFSRSSPASVLASARATSTACVLEARSSHQPSSVSTRTPSVSDTFAPSVRSRAATSSITSNLRVSSQSKRTSGVLTTCGSASRTRRQLAVHAREDAERPHRRHTARRRSRTSDRRRRYARDISPASGQPVSAIFDLIRLCPVFHISGLPPAFAISSNSTWLAFTSAMIVAPGCSLQHVARQQHHQLVAEQDVARVVDQPDAVRVAVEARCRYRRLCAATSAISCSRFAGTVGSGWCAGNRPSIAPFSTVCSPGSAATSRCSTSPAAPLPLSQTTFSMRSPPSQSASRRAT